MMIPRCARCARCDHNHDDSPHAWQEDCLRRMADGTFMCWQCADDTGREPEWAAGGLTREYPLAPDNTIPADASSCEETG